jgi:hypothetical protein
MVASLPLASVHAIGGARGRIVYWASATYRRRLRENMARAGYRDPKRIAAAAREAGKQGVETPWIWMRPRSDLIARTEVVDMSIVDAAIEAPRLWAVKRECRLNLEPRMFLTPNPRRAGPPPAAPLYFRDFSRNTAPRFPAPVPAAGPTK